MIIPLKPILQLASNPSLLKHFSSGELDNIWNRVWNEYESLLLQLPEEKTMGATILLHFAAASVAMFHTLQERNISEDLAYQLMAEIAWTIYEKMGRIPKAIGFSIHSEPYEQLQTAIHSFLHFPFGPPSYKIQEVKADESVVAFDVLRCPISEFFLQQDLPRLCKHTFCDLDYSLANLWNAELKRTETLVEGYQRCNFRWHTKASEQVSSHDVTGKDQS